MKRILLFILLFVPSFISANTIATDILTDTTWSKQLGPYVVQGFIIVDPGATLTIEEGVVVKFYPGASIVVRGGLVTEGIGSSKVIFTSIKDDSAGGDTNNDGLLTSPTQNSWDGLIFENGSIGNVSHAVIRYAGSSLGGIINNGGNVAINTTYIYLNSQRGMWHKSGTTTIQDSVIQGDLFGVYFDSGKMDVSSTTFRDIGSYGISAATGGAIDFKNVTFDNVYSPGMISANSDFSSSGSVVNGGSMNGYLRFGEIDKDQVWKGGDLVYVINFLGVPQGKTLTLTDGIILKFQKDERLYSHGSLIVSGTEEKPIVFTSYLDDAIGGDTNMNGYVSIPKPKDWYGVLLEQGSNTVINNAQFYYTGTNDNSGIEPSGSIGIKQGNVLIQDTLISHAGDMGIEIRGGELNVSNSIIKNNQKGILSRGGLVSISQSSIVDNVIIGIENYSQEVIEAAQNWWGSELGPYQFDTNPSGVGDEVSVNVHYSPWLSTEPGQYVECCSNVAFLPGMGGSRLYRPGVVGVDKLWEPNSINDIDQLMMSTSTGASLLHDIYTEELVDETYLRIDEWPGTNTYKTFAKFLDDELVETGTINEWKPLVYDWRFDLPQLIHNGVVSRDNNGVERISYISATSTGYIIAELKRLADTSKTGKVTLISHSNGGLVAKYLIQYLEQINDPLLSKIDTIVLVAVPQLGTPEAITTLLHGTTKIGKGKERNLVEDMKSAYHLLPSQKYFDVVNTPVIEFSPDVSVINQITDLASTSISTYEGMKSFVTGRGGMWQDPVTSDIDTPNVLNGDFIQYAEGVHSLLDNYEFPESIKVTQIAGVGIDTVRGVEYDDCDIPFCSDSLSTLDRTLLQTKRGDGTVVVESASFGDRNNYQFDLEAYNSDNFVNRKHGSLFEINEIKNVIKQIVNNIEIVENIYLSKNDLNQNIQSYNFKLHSPLSLHLYDNQGHHTGIVETQNGIRYYEANIPNSYYREFGEVKYSGVSNSESVQMKLVGESDGIFTLEVEKSQGDSLINEVTYSNIPTVSGMIVTLPPLEQSDEINNIPLSIDIDGNGIVDVILEKGDGISEYEAIGYIKGLIGKLQIPEKRKQNVQKILQRIEKIIEKEKGCIDKKRKEKCEYRMKLRSDLVFKKLELTLEKFAKRELISRDEMNQILSIIKQ